MLQEFWYLTFSSESKEQGRLAFWIKGRFVYFYFRSKHELWPIKFIRKEEPLMISTWTRKESKSEDRDRP